jgi:hypothetical protein
MQINIIGKSLIAGVCTLALVGLTSAILLISYCGIHAKVRAATYVDTGVAVDRLPTYRTPAHNYYRNNWM